MNNKGKYKSKGRMLEAESRLPPMDDNQKSNAYPRLNSEFGNSPAESMENMVISGQ